MRRSTIFFTKQNQFFGCKVPGMRGWLICFIWDINCMWRHLNINKRHWVLSAHVYCNKGRNDSNDWKNLFAEVHYSVQLFNFHSVQFTVFLTRCQWVLASIKLSSQTCSPFFFSHGWTTVGKEYILPKFRKVAHNIKLPISFTVTAILLVSIKDTNLGRKVMHAELQLM